MKITLLLIALANALSIAHPAWAGQLAGCKLLLTYIRTGDTEEFIVDPDSGDAFNVSRSPRSEDRYPCWSLDGKWISFRITDEAYRRNKERIKPAQSPNHQKAGPLRWGA